MRRTIFAVLFARGGYAVVGQAGGFFDLEMGQDVARRAHIGTFHAGDSRGVAA